MNLREEAGFRQLVRKFALLNAVKHGGKAQTGAVVGKILGERPEYRGKVKELSALIYEIVEEVNGLSPVEQKRIVDTEWPEAFVKEKAEEKRLPALPNVSNYPHVVTRYAPNPDCVLHLGSARAIVLCHEYAQMYKGKFVLRFEDTDPKLKRPPLDIH